MSLVIDLYYFGVVADAHLPCLTRTPGAGLRLETNRIKFIEVNTEDTLDRESHMHGNTVDEGSVVFTYHFNFQVLSQTVIIYGYF